MLVTHALAACGFGGTHIYLIIGLPVDQFYKNGALNQDLIEKKSDSSARLVSCIGKGAALALITGQSVVSESAAAFYDALI